MLCPTVTGDGRSGVFGRPQARPGGTARRSAEKVGVGEMEAGSCCFVDVWGMRHHPGCSQPAPPKCKSLGSSSFW